VAIWRDVMAIPRPAGISEQAYRLSRVRVLAAVITALALSAVTGATPGSTAPQLEVRPWTKPLAFVAGLAYLPDGRALVTEKDTGLIRVVERTGAVRPEPFAKLTVYSGGEYGLLGIAVHPQFRRYPFVYVTYVEPTRAGTPRRGRLVRFRWRSGVGVSRRILLDNFTVNDAFIHVGGVMAWQRTYLLVTVGDGAPARPVAEAAQDTSSLRGKILRITRDGKPAPGNPFGNEVLSYGHRNSYGLTVDSRSGAIYETENGPDQSDEVNRIAPGVNYGWPICQGFDRDCVEPSAYRAPIWESGNTTTVAPTGIVSYRGTRVLGLKDTLAVCAFGTGEILALRLQADGKLASVRRYASPAWRCGSFLVEAPDGTLVFHDQKSGRIMRIVR
jgi:glucose/arabinose dehydrogenase